MGDAADVEGTGDGGIVGTAEPMWKHTNRINDTENDKEDYKEGQKTYVNEHYRYLED